ncbi:hypothetical protein DVH24_010193, partial [Malus domestica]
RWIENSILKAKFVLRGFWISGILAYKVASVVRLSCNGDCKDPGRENEKKLAHLWRLEGTKERLRLVKADLMEEGSFDDAIFGCHGVFHSASPVLKTSSDPKARAWFSSSSAAVRVRPDGDFTSNVPLDESSWSSVELWVTLQIWYPMSKILAEEAGWDFCKENGIDMVTVLPSFVIGPCLPPELCSTASDVLGLLKGETEKFKWHGRMGYVHIDDVALCHILVYEHESAHGRYICSSTVTNNTELGSLLSTRYPSLPIPTKFEQLGRPHYYELNISKMESLGSRVQV